MRINTIDGVAVSDPRKPWELTLRQYETMRRTEVLAEYPAATGAQYDRDYPPGSCLNEWVQAIHHGAHTEHAIIPARVLDDLCRRRESAYWSLRHDHPRAIPEGYLPPSIRAANAAAPKVYKRRRH
jgi:hypothetical protein